MVSLFVPAWIKNTLFLIIIQHFILSGVRCTQCYAGDSRRKKIFFPVFGRNQG